MQSIHESRHGTRDNPMRSTTLVAASTLGRRDLGRDTHSSPLDSCTRCMDLTTAPRATIQTPRTVEPDGAWKLEKRATEKSGRAGRVSVTLPAKRLLMQPIVSSWPRRVPRFSAIDWLWASDSRLKFQWKERAPCRHREQGRILARREALTGRLPRVAAARDHPFRSVIRTCTIGGGWSRLTFDGNEHTSLTPAQLPGSV